MMKLKGIGFHKFVKKWADLFWNLYSMLTLYVTFSSATELLGKDMANLVNYFSEKHEIIFPIATVGLFFTASLRAVAAAYEIWPNTPTPIEKPEGMDQKVSA